MMTTQVQTEPKTSSHVFNNWCGNLQTSVKHEKVKVNCALLYTTDKYLCVCPKVTENEKHGTCFDTIYNF